MVQKSQLLKKKKQKQKKHGLLLYLFSAPFISYMRYLVNFKPIHKLLKKELNCFSFFGWNILKYQIKLRKLTLKITKLIYVRSILMMMTNHVLSIQIFLILPWTLNGSFLVCLFCFLYIISFLFHCDIYIGQSGNVVSTACSTSRLREPSVIVPQTGKYTMVLVGFKRTNLLFCHFYFIWNTVPCTFQSNCCKLIYF